jgi:hypothetical protein
MRYVFDGNKSRWPGDGYAITSAIAITLGIGLAMRNLRLGR